VANYNVVKDYDWTSIPRGSGLRARAPYVLLKSYKIKSSESLNRINNYVNVAKKLDSDAFYDKLYGRVSSPEDTFFIPFFGDSVRSFSNEYGDTFQSAFLGGLDQAMGAGMKLVGEGATYNLAENSKQLASNALNATEGIGRDIANNKSTVDIMKNAASTMSKGYSTAPGSYIETPKLYQYAQNDSGLEVSFVLSNTINSDYKKNTELVEHLTTINRPRRENSIVMEPPRIFEVKLSGIRYIRWASCSNFSVSLLGTKRLINDKIIPEGYMINMTFTSLTTEVSNFMKKI
jgi:hypothetical protein